MTKIWILAIGFAVALATAEEVDKFGLTDKSREAIYETVKKQGAMHVQVNDHPTRPIRMVLKVMVPSGMDQSKARLVGENCVRIAKAISSDDLPAKEIGSGKFTYVVAIYRPDKTIAELGLKGARGWGIYWYDPDEIREYGLGMVQ